MGYSISTYSRYFALCAFGGVLSCGITHTAVTPLDLVKCRLQVSKVPYSLPLGGGLASVLGKNIKM